MRDKVGRVRVISFQPHGRGSGEPARRTHYSGHHEGVVPTEGKVALMAAPRHIPRAAKRVSVAVTAFAVLGTMALSACTPASNNDPSSSSTAAKKDAVFTTIDGNKAINPGGPMNPYNAKSNMFSGYNTQQLAYTKLNATDINDFYPALAEKWEWSSDLKTLKVTLHPKAGWSDGSPVTAKDVVTSFAAGIVAGTASGLNLAKAEANGDKTVTFTQLEGTKPSRTFQMNILSTVIVRDAEYGSLLPADIWSTIAASQGADAAAVKAAKDKIAELTPKITAHAPAKDISNGPFSITAINPGEAVMEKNPNFWAAEKVGPTKLLIRNYAGNQEIWNYLQSGQLDFGPFTAMPENTKDAIIAAGNKMVQSPSPVQASLAFNQSVAPYDKVEVRQAFAYLLDRTAITKVGQPVGGSPVELQSGATKASFDAWATPETKAKMVDYKNDKAKAEELLKTAGMTKSGDKWMMADGKPFTVTLQTVTGFSDWIAGSNVVCSQLTDFGIPCQVQVSADFASYQADMKAQKFPLGWWLVSVGTNPPAQMGRIFGDTYGYKLVGGNVTYAPASQKDGGNWMGGPQEIKIATGETIKPGELTANMNYQSRDEQKPVMQQLFLAENTSLPVIGMWDYTNTVFVNEKRFTKFPDGSEPGLMRLSPGVWMSHGYIQPK